MTIGGYGYSPEGFLATLKGAGVDLFVDIRQRRGVRGASYAFLNSKKLQELLSIAGIQYLYAPELAPSQDIRKIQNDLDKGNGVQKSKRVELSPEFKSAYVELVLGKIDKLAMIKKFNGASIVCFFCIEASPCACHRSLVEEFFR